MSAVERSDAFLRRPRVQADVLILLKLYQDGGPAATIHADELLTLWDKDTSPHNVYTARIDANKLLKQLTDAPEWNLALTAQISSSPYHIEIERAARSQNIEDPFGAFWRAYCSGSRKSKILFTSPLFFRDDAGHYIRNIHANSVEEKGKLENVVKGSLEAWKPSRHYYSAGEVLAALALFSELLARGAKAEFGIADPLEETSGADHHLLSIGSGRTNWLIQHNPRKLHYDLDPGCSSIRIDGKPSTYGDFEDIEHLVCFAVITRCPGVYDDVVTTLIAANHGRAAEGAGKLIADGERLRRLINILGGGIPETFQAIVGVKIGKDRFESCISHVEILAVWSEAMGHQPLAVTERWTR